MEKKGRLVLRRCALGSFRRSARLGRQGCNEPRRWRWDLLAAAGCWRTRVHVVVCSGGWGVVVVMHTGSPLSGMDSPVSGSTWGFRVICLNGCSGRYSQYWLKSLSCWFVLSTGEGRGLSMKWAVVVVRAGNDSELSVLIWHVGLTL